MMYNKRKKAMLGLLLAMSLVLTLPVLANEDDQIVEEVNGLTIMYYCDADNNLESSLLEDIAEMKTGIKDGTKVIALVDRIPNYSSNSTILGENFTDTRLYEIAYNEEEQTGKATRISGGSEFAEITEVSNYEANMGDANTLAKFIDFCKANYSARKYALIMSNHGGGVRTEEDAETADLNKAVCWDDTNGHDTLYTGEISDVLELSHSVDLLGYDACLMGSAEIAYQYRPGNGGFEAQVMVASAPTEWGNGWRFDNILERIKVTNDTDNGENDLTMGEQEKYYSPNTMTMLELGGIIVEEQRDSTSARTDQQLSCYDLSHAGNVKTSVDAFAKALHTGNSNLENIRGNIMAPNVIHYFRPYSSSEQINYPFFDLYDLAKRTNEDDVNYSQVIRDKAAEVMTAVDNLVAYSFAGSKFNGFTDSQNGVSIFFPKGDNNAWIYDQVAKKYVQIRHWSQQWWYNPLDTTVSMGEGKYYGKIKWCADGLNPTIDDVGNWFELLDSWYDSSNDANGGLNRYQW